MEKCLPHLWTSKYETKHVETMVIVSRLGKSMVF
jgi:hypothetical protein